MLIGYARVSTDDQRTDGQHLRLKNEGCEEIFSDTYTGTEFDRPGLEKMLNFARKDDVIVVVRLDRLGRSLKELLRLVDEFDKRGVHFKSLQESIDTSTSTGRFVFHLFGAIAEFERNLISERTKDGLKSVVQKGIKLGRPSIEQETIEQIILEFDSGLSAKDISKKLNISLSSVYTHKPKKGDKNDKSK